jgi:hypothetical protein
MIGCERLDVIHRWREQNNAINSTDRQAIADAIKDSEICDRLYRTQLAGLKPRLSKRAWAFFENVSLHDGTLLAFHAGDDIDKRFHTFRTMLVNKRRLTVRLDVLNQEETRLYHLTYTRVRRVIFDYPTDDPWCIRYEDPAASPVDDWMFDALTAADDEFLRHEVMFSSGATVAIEFRRFGLKTSRVQGRRNLPLL